MTNPTASSAVKFCAFVLLTCSLLPVKLVAQVRPNADWQQITSNHFRVVFEPGLDSLAQHAIRRAELEHARLSAGLVPAPRRKIDIVIGDNTDITNGFATPFPDNRIYLYARPPVEELSLQYYEDWMDLVVSHELTHIFHLEQAGKVGRGLRTVFGRLPFGWPLFPIAEMPRWNLEGLATMIESQHTHAGRVEGSYHEMVVRTDVLEHRFQPIDRVSGETPIWPGGMRAYIYGSLFMDYIARRYGEAAHTELIRKTAGSILPPSWRLDAIAKKAVGKTYRDLYDEWHAQLDSAYAPLAASLKSAGLTQSETITTSGRQAYFARIAPDNRTLAYADENGRDVSATRVIDMQTHGDERIRRNGLGPLAWLRDGSGYITAQYEFDDPYEIFSDLYVVRNGQETRLTRGERAETPDLSPDGNTVVYMQNVHGTNRLVLRDMPSGASRVLVEASPDAQWILPRFSPDGKRIAVQRWARGRGHDVAIIGLDGRIESEIRTSGTDAAPAWSPDGKYVLFSSDRTGITNLYASDGTAIRQVTNVIGGAFYPDVSSDGRWIYFSGYHADGFHIERMPYDPASWRAPAPESTPAAWRPSTIAPPPAEYGDVDVQQPRRYSALRSALPTFWIPVAFGDTALGTFFGAATFGTDDVQRHTYFVQVAADEHGRVSGDLNYSYAGLGNPIVNLDLAREWDYTGKVSLRDSAGNVVDRLKSYEREDRITLSTTLLSQKWRQSAAFTVGVEGVVLHRGILGNAQFRDPRDRMIGVLGGVGFGHYRVPAYAISLEDGVRGSIFGRRRFELNPYPGRDASYSEITGSGAAYKSIDWFGFAHQALAVRGSGLVRTGTGVGPEGVGGVVEFLPVRGFSSDERIGYRAWTASLEYRVPVALIGRGFKLRPLFIDRVSTSLFADAGNAYCNAEQRSIYLGCAASDRGVLASAGAEINAHVAVFTFFPAWLRGGVAFPVRGGSTNPKFYLALGRAF